jgi:hypothetical protein
MSAEYKKEYKKYLNTWNKYPLIMPSFLDHIRGLNEESAKAKSWDKCAYYDRIEREETEESESDLYFFADDTRIDNDNL